nr:MAG TPA: hypothetical protein [Caudoviricetes sp.]
MASLRNFKSHVIKTSIQMDPTYPPVSIYHNTN